MKRPVRESRVKQGMGTPGDQDSCRAARVKLAKAPETLIAGHSLVGQIHVGSPLGPGFEGLPDNALIPGSNKS